MLKTNRIALLLAVCSTAVVGISCNLVGRQTEVDLVAGFAAPDPIILEEGGLQRIRMNIVTQCNKADPINHPTCFLDGDLETPAFNVIMLINHADGSQTSTNRTITFDLSESLPFYTFDFSDVFSGSVEAGINEIVAIIDPDDEFPEPNETPGQFTARQYLSVGAAGDPQVNGNNLSISAVAVTAETCQPQTSLTDPYADLRVSYSLANARPTPSDDVLSAVMLVDDDLPVVTDPNEFYLANGSSTAAFYQTSSLAEQSNRSDDFLFRVSGTVNLQADRRFDICIGVGGNDVSPADNCQSSGVFNVVELCEGS